MLWPPGYRGLILCVGLMFMPVDLVAFLVRQSSRLAGGIFQREQIHGISGQNEAGWIKALAANTYRIRQ